MDNPLWTRIENVARRRGAAPAVLQGARALSFADLAARAAALATGLAARGIAPGDRAVLAAANSADLMIWAAALWRCGAIPVLAQADAPPAHLAHFCATVAPALIVTDRADDPASAGIWPPHIPRHRPDDIPDDIPATDPVMAQSAPAAPRAGDEPASIVFTSGSSGLPKGVVQAGATLIDGAARVGGYLGYRDADRILCPVPFAFDYGWGQALSCLFEGQTLVLPDRAGGFGICAALADHAPTVLAGVPAVFADLVAGLAPIRETPRDSIRLITNTGSKIPLRVFGALCDLFPAAAISLNYGLTETYRSASLPVALARSHPDAVGHAIPGASLAILTDDGQPAPPGTPGEIVHRGAGVFLGYWGAPDKTAQVRRPDPLGGPGPAVFTGDLGVIGADGLLRILGRRDRQMKSMGVRVSPDEIETIVQASGLVAEAAVIALPDEMLGDLIVACVLPLTAGADARALKKALTLHARDHMSPYMRPRRWEIVDSLPRTRSAKIDYPALRRAVEAET